MKNLPAFILTLLLSTACLAADVLYIPNLRENATGTLQGSKVTLDTTVLGTVVMTPSPNPLPVTFPGGVTANQGAPGPAASPWPVVDDAAGASLTSIDGKTPALVGGRVPIDGSGVTQPVSAASLPLPTGAATESTLSTVNGKLPSTVAADRTTAAAPGAVRLSDGSAFYNALTDTQLRATAVPISGTVNQGSPTGVSNKWPVKVADDSNNVLTFDADGANLSSRNANATDVAPGSATGAAESEAAPADAVGFILSADGANTDSIRYRMGGTASATAGHELEPGRDSGFIPAAASLSIFAVSGTQAYQLSWVRR